MKKMKNIIVIPASEPESLKMPDQVRHDKTNNKKRFVSLYIDTSKTNETKVAFQIGGEKKEKVIVSQYHSSQKVLPILESLLGENNLTLGDITAIDVATGPGSFTGLRVGAAIGNMLGWLLQAPVNGKRTPLAKLNYGDDRWN